MATDPAVLEYLQRAGLLPMPEASPEPDIQGLIAAQNADAETRRNAALGRSGEMAAAAVGRRAPQLSPFEDKQQAVKDFVTREQIVRKAAEENLAKKKLAQQSEMDKAKFDLATRQAGGLEEYRKAQIASLAGRPELEREKLAANEAYRQKQLELAKERNQIARISAMKPSGGSAGAVQTDDIQAYVDGVQSGILPPPSGRLTGNLLKANAELSRRGFDTSKALMQWKAQDRLVSSLNSGTQVRLGQATRMVRDSLDKVEELYNAWEQKGMASQFPKLNKMDLAAAVAMGGERGAVAQPLLTLINDLILEQATVLMGGGVPTDKAMNRAEENLQAQWGSKTFKEALKLLKFNTNTRLSVLSGSQTNMGSGIDEVNPYAKTTVPGATPQAKYRYNPETDELEPTE